MDLRRVPRPPRAAGRWSAGHTVVVLHSGGVPALFAYHDTLAAHLARRG